MKDLLATAAIDVNGGDGRLDFVVATKKGKPADMSLMNRGYGAFWPNNEASLGSKAFSVTKAALTAADMNGGGRHSLLILTTKGELLQLESPPYKGGKPVE